MKNIVNDKKTSVMGAIVAFGAMAYVFYCTYKNTPIDNMALGSLIGLSLLLFGIKDSVLFKNDK